MTPEQWEAAIGTAMGQQQRTIRAVSFYKAFSTFSKPALLSCQDASGRGLYVVKSLRRDSPKIGRSLVADHVVARLGLAIGAPVGECVLVDVSAELIESEPALAHFVSGVAHGCRHLSDVGERAFFEYVDVPENRSRFASLAVLYGWIHANDHQFLYQLKGPHLVYSVDHGHFFHNGPDWSVQSLQDTPPPTLDQKICDNCRLTPDEIRLASHRLTTVTEDTVARAVAGPPLGWGVAMSERIALADYLFERCRTLGSNLGLQWPAA